MSDLHMKEINRNSNKENLQLGKSWTLFFFFWWKKFMLDESSELFHEVNKHMDEDDQVNMCVF